MMKSALITTGIVFALIMVPMLVREYYKQHPTNCRIVGDHEIVTGGCIPYCPPNPSECG